MALVYTNIQHAFRKHHKLTNNEYVFCDMIFYLSKATLSKIPGWCYMTKEKIGEELGVSKQSVITLSSKLIDQGFLEKQEVTGFLKTTSKWEMVYFTTGKESLPPEKINQKLGKESLPSDGKESLPNNNQLNNNNLIIQDDSENNLFSKSDFLTLPEKVLNYLNEKKGLSRENGYKPTASNLKHIKARLKEKFSFDDMKKVVDAAILKWSKDQKMKQYIRPETLFGDKMNTYLLESDSVVKSASETMAGAGNFTEEPIDNPVLK